MPARSSSSQRRSRGHSRISASCATSAEPSLERDEARVGEPLEQRVDGVGRGRARRHQLVARHAPAGVDGALAELGHPQEDAAREGAPVGGQAVDHGVGRARDRGRHAAAGAVALDGERAPVAALPGRAQGV